MVNFGLMVPSDGYNNSVVWFLFIWSSGFGLMIQSQKILTFIIFVLDVRHDSDQIQLRRVDVSKQVWRQRKMGRSNPPDPWSRMVCCFLGILYYISCIWQVKQVKIVEHKSFIFIQNWVQCKRVYESMNKNHVWNCV